MTYIITEICVHVFDIFGTNNTKQILPKFNTTAVEYGDFKSTRVLHVLEKKNTQTEKTNTRRPLVKITHYAVCTVTVCIHTRTHA